MKGAFLRRLFKKPPPPPPPVETAPVEAIDANEAAPADVDDSPEWKKRIDRINELCEQRKREMQLRQGARIVVEVDETNKREA